MGYTHYWRFEHDGISEANWVKVAADVRALLAASPVTLQIECDQAEPPLVDDDQIRFNGVEEDGH